MDTYNNLISSAIRNSQIANPKSKFTGEDLKSIAAFNKIVMNYLKMAKLSEIK